MFDHLTDNVLLIRKDHPEWQSGFLNGVGGQIEHGESPWVAMRREFKEEAGLFHYEWERFAIVQGDWGHVHFFRAWGNIWRAEAQTSEQLEIYPMALLPTDEMIPNLKFLLPLAAHSKDTYRIVLFEEIEDGRRPY